MKAKVVVELDTETADEIVRHSLQDSILSVRNMIEYYEKSLERDAELSYREVEYYDKCLKESKQDLKALKHVHNYFAPTEEHID